MSRRRVGVWLLLLGLGAGAVPGREDAGPLQRAEALCSGVGGRLDLEEARRLFETAAATGEAAARLRVAILRALGTCGFAADRQRAEGEAAAVLPELASVGPTANAYVDYLIGMTHLIGLGRPERPAVAVRWLNRAAAGGEVWAMWNLGWIYESGSGVDADAEASISWYERAAEAGHLRAMVVAGEAYMGARPGRAIDPAAARRWLDRAAAAEVPGALTRIGEMHARGLGGPRDASAAAAWYRRAAAGGETLAMYLLSGAHFSGEGVTRDYTRAVDWLRQAAAGGFFYAVYDLADLYDFGLRDGSKVILEADVGEAAVWYRKAAEQGSLEARGWLIYYERELRDR